MVSHSKLTWDSAEIDRLLCELGGYGANLSRDRDRLPLDLELLAPNLLTALLLPRSGSPTVGKPWKPSWDSILQLKIKETTHKRTERFIVHR